VSPYHIIRVQSNSGMRGLRAHRGCDIVRLLLCVCVCVMMMIQL
jgi:hypothetical protein